VLAAAAGTGLTLTRATQVIHYDRWWNPAVEDQATDRAHRIGQTSTVSVHRLISEGTVEERVADVLTQKRQLQAPSWAPASTAGLAASTTVNWATW
jgi:SNF2 family DNA or RNA helicase